jgi:molybdopterin synthase sulfur carrier subunit
VPTIRLFASAREAAGTGRDLVGGATVTEVLGEACVRYGSPFTELLATCRVWVNGEPATGDDKVGEHDEVAVLPPVSGGAVPTAEARSASLPSPGADSRSASLPSPGADSRSASLPSPGAGARSGLGR